jgi:hypothetical protein
VKQQGLLKSFCFGSLKCFGPLHDTFCSYGMQTVAARPSTKVIQYLLNEATRFVACDSLPVDQWMRIKKKFHFYIATL